MMFPLHAAPSAKLKEENETRALKIKFLNSCCLKSDISNRLYLTYPYILAICSVIMSKTLYFIHARRKSFLILFLFLSLPITALGDGIYEKDYTSDEYLDFYRNMLSTPIEGQQQHLIKFNTPDITVGLSDSIFLSSSTMKQLHIFEKAVKKPIRISGSRHKAQIFISVFQDSENPQYTLSLIHISEPTRPY